MSARKYCAALPLNIVEKRSSSVNKFILVGLGIFITGWLSSGSAIALRARYAIAKVSIKEVRMTPTIDTTLIAQSETALIADNKQLLASNGQLALKILKKVGGTVPSAATPTGSPLQQNQTTILNNRNIFLAIAKAVKATVPAIPPKSSSKDLAEQNNSLLLGNRVIVIAIAKKLGVTLPPPASPSGSFVQKNNALLKGNGNALKLIAAKVGA